MTLMYRAPREGEQSSIDTGNNSEQMRSAFAIKKALIDVERVKFFSQLGDSQDLPKHFGKTVRVYHYIRLLDDRNINDQGIDANGNKVPNGNLFGSSTDINVVTGKLPFLKEGGGVVNQVGFSREILEGSIFELGMFYSFTKDTLNFDSDSELKTHLARELLVGANEISEKIIERDLLLAAGTKIFGGAATSIETVTGEGATPSLLEYEDFWRLDQILTANDAPKEIKMVVGSTKVDTRVIPSSRAIYVAPEVVPMLRKMKGAHGEAAFIDVQHYADAAKTMRGEIGSIDCFRVIEVPRMMHFGGQGAEATDNPGYRTTVGADKKERYNVYPLMVVTSGSFSHIGFQGKGGLKFDIMTKMPGIDTASLDNDPFGTKGFSSIKWYEGTLIKWSERIGIMYVVAPI